MRKPDRNQRWTHFVIRVDPWSAGATSNGSRPDVGYPSHFAGLQPCAPTRCALGPAGAIHETAPESAGNARQARPETQGTTGTASRRQSGVHHDWGRWHYRGPLAAPELRCFAGKKAGDHHTAFSLTCRHLKWPRKAAAPGSEGAESRSCPTRHTSPRGAGEQAQDRTGTVTDAGRPSAPPLQPRRSPRPP